MPTRTSALYVQSTGSPSESDEAVWVRAAAAWSLGQPGQQSGSSGADKGQRSSNWQPGGSVAAAARVSREIGEVLLLLKENEKMGY